MQAVYAIVNKINGKRYIGSTNNYKRRKREHISTLQRNVSGSKVLQKAWNRYGLDAFEFIILEVVKNAELLFEREQWWVDNTPCQYNMNKKDVRTCREVSDETREKLRKSITGVKHPEWRKKLKSQAQGGKNHWAYGKKMKEETRVKKSNTMKEKYAAGYKHPNAKTVEQYTLNDEFLREYVSTHEAQRITGIHNVAIGNVALGKSKSAGGFKWRYKHE